MSNYLRESFPHLFHRPQSYPVTASRSFFFRAKRSNLRPVDRLAARPSTGYSFCLVSLYAFAGSLYYPCARAIHVSLLRARQLQAVKVNADVIDLQKVKRTHTERDSPQPSLRNFPSVVTEKYIRLQSEYDKLIDSETIVAICRNVDFRSSDPNIDGPAPVSRTWRLQIVQWSPAWAGLIKVSVLSIISIKHVRIDQVRGLTRRSYIPTYPSVLFTGLTTR